MLRGYSVRKRILSILLSIALIVPLLLCSCYSDDPLEESVYMKNLYVWDGGAWVPATGGGGAVDFTDLADVPNSYVGDAGKFARVNVGESGLEFAAVAPGADGKTILSDVIDPTVEGTDGDFFLNTASYDFFKKITGAWVLQCNIKGANGANGSNGTNGNTVLSDVVDPTVEGVDGDFFLNTVSYDLFKKITGSWVLQCNIKGATGAQGIQGIQGIQGVPGPSQIDDSPRDGITDYAISSNWAFDHNAATTGTHGAGANTLLNTGDVDDTPVDAATTAPVSSNWAYDHIHEYATGSTFPVSPYTGELFLHVVTGRKILYEYSGTAWVPLVGLGSVSIYISSTGTNDILHGTGTGTNAFLTLSYAISVLPPLITSSLIFHFGSGSYSLSSFSNIACISISIHGTMSTLLSATSDAGSSYASGASLGDSTGTGWTVNAYQNKLFYNTIDSTYGIVDSNTATDIYSNYGTDEYQDFEIYDWATTLSITTLTAPTCPVFFYNLYASVSYIHSTSVYYYQCRLANTIINQGTICRVIDCFCSSNTLSISVGMGCHGIIQNSKLCCPDNIGTILYNRGQLDCQGVILDGIAGANKATYGVDTAIGLVSLDSMYIYSIVRNCDTGVYSHNGGQVVDTVNVQYSGNGADETAVAASYGYID
jgi:hypothetical protein